jgi:drug/metabolite transporter (DMT)-like permease
MALHQNSGNWQLGLGLSAVSVVMWSTLPVGLTVVLQFLDVYTITWFRFACSFSVLAGYLFWRQELPGLMGVRSQKVTLFFLAIVGLSINYLLFVKGLDQTSPTNAEVIIQLAPVLTSLGALAIFRERYSPWQAGGLFTLMVGMLLFFNQQVQQWFDVSSQYLAGCGLLVISAIAWAIYALAQKQLLLGVPSKQIMLLIYGGCALLFSPMAEPQSLSTLTPLAWGMLIFCGFNTLLAYGAFAEALNHWDTSRISAILSLTPLTTLAVVLLTNSFWPSLIAPERMTLLSVVGAVIVVVGSLTIALGQTQRRKPALVPEKVAEGDPLNR